MTKIERPKTDDSQRSRQAIASNLQLARMIFNLSQEDLGARCQLHRSHIGAIERQKVSVGIDTVERLARVFGVPAYALLMPTAELQLLLHGAFTAQSERAA